MVWDVAVPLAAASSSAAWARLASARAGAARSGSTALALLGGVAAAGLALAAYDLAARLGIHLRWDAVTAGGAGAIGAAAAIGLVEEGAKLAGLLLVVEGPAGRAAALAASAGVAAGFAAVEAVVTLGGEPSAPVLARATLGPVAHALLAVPLAGGVAARGARRAWAIPAALAASAALHALGDLGVSMGGTGRLVYPASLAVPAAALFVAARRGRK